MYSTIIMRESPNVYQQHGLVGRLFPDQRVLYYVEGKMIRVLSKEPIKHSTYRSKLIDLDSFKVGDAHTFCSRINPIKASSISDKIIALHGKDAELFALNRYAQAGIRVISHTMTYEGYTIVDKIDNTIPFSTYHVCGILEIVDLKKFKNAVLNGFVGRGKAFGYNAFNIID